jgi:transposase
VNRRDFRSIGRNAQEALRERAVYLVVNEEMTQGEAARAVGVHRQVVNRWVQRHQDAGAAGLLDGRRVSPRRGCGILTAAEARRVQGWITAKCPDQMQLPFALWTAPAVRELIQRKFGKDLGLSTMQLYLKRWGFTSQKPLERATPRDPQKIRAWLEREYPSLAARAKREKAAIYWGDETGICNQDQIGPFGKNSGGYAPKRQTPVRHPTAQKFSTSMIAAVSNRGLMRFRLYEGALNIEIFIDFMKRLIKDAKRRVFFIVDNLRVHHAKKVRAWLAQHEDEIEVFYLPAYAPEHNPDEYLNNDLKQNLKNKPQPKDREQLVSAASSVLRSIERKPGRVTSYFHVQHVRYVA